MQSPSLTHAVGAARHPAAVAAAAGDAAAPTSPRRTPRKPAASKSAIPCHDPGTGELLGYVPAMGAAEVRSLVGAAKAAGAEWRCSSFAQRRLLLKVILKFIVETLEEICR